jgi:hypothetical protein
MFNGLKFMDDSLRSPSGPVFGRSARFALVPPAQG